MKGIWPVVLIPIVAVGIYFSSEEEVVTIRVADVGAGLGTVTLLPDGKVMVYDAGRYTRLMPTLRELIPNRKIDILVLSHNDADHIGAVEQIESEFDVGEVYYSRFRDEDGEKKESLYVRTMRALERMKKKGTRLIAVSNTDPAPGTVIYEQGEVRITYLCGFSDPYAIWKFKKADIPSKPRNAISLMLRLDFNENSIIYGGDAVGKLEGDNCVYTEAFLLKKVSADLLNADIILSPHHGADNGDCDAFIKAVSPEYVIFSAGSEHGHPRATTAQRYLDNGVKVENMLRTDRGDDEKKYGKLEWAQSRIQGCIDQPHDDDIEIILQGTSTKVSYVYPDKCLCKDAKLNH